MNKPKLCERCGVPYPDVWQICPACRDAWSVHVRHVRATVQKPNRHWDKIWDAWIEEGRYLRVLGMTTYVNTD